jgi:IclR family mhp operon transcriptional activator
MIGDFQRTGDDLDSELTRQRAKSPVRTPRGGQYPPATLRVLARMLEPEAATRAGDQDRRHGTVNEWGYGATHSKDTIPAPGRLAVMQHGSTSKTLCKAIRRHYHCPPAGQLHLDPPMTSTRPIRALLRGLEALHVLNLHNGATVSEVAAAIDLPRTTTYRILETLCVAGYAYRAASDERYRLTILVRGLSDGFDDEAWVTQIARPYIYELCNELVWPIAVATLSGTAMLVRQTTDHRSPLAIEKRGPGFRVPILASASGLAYMAFCPEEQREAILDILAKSRREEDKPAKNRKKLRELFAEIRKRGYSSSRRARRVSDEISFSVPVMAGDRLVASLTIRYASTAIPELQAAQRFVPRLRATADRIGQEFTAQAEQDARAAAGQPPQATEKT